MNPNTHLIKEKVRNYLATTLLKNKNIGEITDSTPLITGGLMDSISTMQLINFLEKEFIAKSSKSIENNTAWIGLSINDNIKMAIPKIVIANKSDLEKKVSSYNIRQFIKENRAKSFH